jgi:hypothetical protein
VFMRRNISNILWGLLFIGVGVGLIGNIFKLWDYNVFFDGWWTLFLIVPALVSMIQSGIKIGNVIVLGIGVLLLLDQQKIIPEDLVLKFAAPAVLIIICIAILSKVFFKKSPANPSQTTADEAGTGGASGGGSGKSGIVNSEDNPNYLAVFSGNTVKNNSANFQGVNSTALFGGNEIDLSDVVLARDVDFNIISIFGGTEIKAPKKARVEITGFPIFGGNENTAVSSMDPGAFKITFHCTSIFGGTDIK